MSRYFPNAEDSQCFQPSKMKKCEVDVKEEGCSSKTGGCSSKRNKAGIFAMIAKISLGLRKFRNHSKNFAILAKFSLCENFSRLAKFTVASEISHFRYLCRISLG